MTGVLIAALAAVAVASVWVSPTVRTSGGFFKGLLETGESPGLWTLVLSQVTT